MSKNSKDKKEKTDSNFRWLVICFVLFVISLPAFYFGTGTSLDGQGTVLLVFGFVFLVVGMIISIAVKT